MEFSFYFFVSLACSISLSFLPWREFCSLEQWALQPHRDQCHSQTVTHIYTGTQTHTYTKSTLMRQVPTHIHTTIIQHTHTLIYTLSSGCYFDISSLEGSGFKMRLSPPSSQSPPTPHVTSTWGCLSLSPCLSLLCKADRWYDDRNATDLRADGASQMECLVNPWGNSVTLPRFLTRNFGSSLNSDCFSCVAQEKAEQGQDKIFLSVNSIAISGGYFGFIKDKALGFICWNTVLQRQRSDKLGD